ncbi:MAG: hypothetical protein K8F30_02820 [Taibaiella sp.]|nr:hypothetical protein [Taibaiella sp.]
MRKYLNKHILVSIAIALAPVTVFAAEAATGKGSSFNPLLLGLLSLIIVLLFVIGMMGSTLVQLGYAYRDKMRKERSGVSGAAKSLLLLLAAGAMSLGANAQEAAEAAVAAVPEVTSVGGIPKAEF